MANEIIRFSVHPVAELIIYEMNEYYGGCFNDSYDGSFYADFPFSEYYFYFHPYTFESDEFDRNILKNRKSNLDKN